MDIKEFNPDGVCVNNDRYFGMPFTPEDAELVLISVPWDVTVSSEDGAALAPEDIMEASTQLDFFDEFAPDEWHRGIATVDIDSTIFIKSEKLRLNAKIIIEHLEGGGQPFDENIAEGLQQINEGSAYMNENISTQAFELLLKGKIVGLVGGDHSTPYGLIKALGMRHESFGILHVDAHCDLREGYEGFEFSHASIMFNVLRDIPQVSKITQVAVRDFCKSEVDFAKKSGKVEMFSDMSLADAEFNGETWNQTCVRIVETLPQKVYISFDIDGLTVENCPNTGTPVNGGISFNKAVYLIDSVVKSGREIVGFDLVEVATSPDSKINEITGARMLWKLCGLTLKSNKK